MEGRPSTRNRPRRPARSRSHRKIAYAAAVLALLSVLAAMAAVAARGSGVDDPVDLVLALPSEVSAGTTLFTLPWGDGAGQAGISRLADEEPRGPEAFAVAPDGRFAVIDSVNHRLLLLTADGEQLAAPALDLASPRFVAAGPECVYVLDADDDLTLDTFSWQGDLLDEAPVGPFAEPVTALLLDGDDLPLLETGHETAAPIDPLGRDVSAGPVTVGRPVRTDPLRSVSARLESAGRARVEEVETGRGTDRAWAVTLARGSRVDHIVALGADDGGGVVLGLRVLSGPAGGRGSGQDAGVAHATPGEETSAVLLARFTDKTQTLLLNDVGDVYLGAPCVVGPDGSVYQPVADEIGYRIVKHSFSEVTP